MEVWLHPKDRSMIHVQAEALYIFHTVRMYLAERTRLYPTLKPVFLGSRVVPVVRRKAAIPVPDLLSLLPPLLSLPMCCELPPAAWDSLASDERQGKTLT